MAKAKTQTRNPTKVKAKSKSVGSSATHTKPRVAKNKTNTKKVVKTTSKKSLKAIVKKHSQSAVVEKKTIKKATKESIKASEVTKKPTKPITKKQVGTVAKKSITGDTVKKSTKAIKASINKEIAVKRTSVKTSAKVAEIAKAVMAAKESNLVTKKMKLKAAREARAQAKQAEKALLPQDLEARRKRLKSLIVQGKERGFLTYAEINDHLPDDMQDAEQIEGIISMINDMGITVHDEAPDVEAMLLSEATPAVTDEDVVEEAEAALSTVDSEFGRTTDPVRMYMREMGSVELLTREGEIEIAKRIEDGLKHMIQAISACIRYSGIS
jgi:RNA polymerase primary sigma factor